MTTAEAEVEAVLESALARVDLAAAEGMAGRRGPFGKARKFLCRTCRREWQVYGPGGSCALCIRTGRVRLCRRCDNGYVGSGFPCNNCGAQDGGLLHEAEAFSGGTGLTRENVCWMQNVLDLAEGESLTTDGLYGLLTRAAVVRFQQKYGLRVDGIVGPQTEAALIQTGLNRSALASLVPINGVMDNITRQEVVRFQQAHGLAADGIVGPRTRAAMVMAMGGRCPVFPAGPPSPSPPPPTPSGSVWTQGCSQQKLDSLLQQCESTYRKCVATCGLDGVIGQLKQIPALMGCTKYADPKLILLCALASGGKDLIDGIINAKSCIDTCSSNVDPCQINARTAANCRQSS
jgi:peptidoglycan hydrolase-like protein with peptidoglycan-binding domain